MVAHDISKLSQLSVVDLGVQRGTKALFDGLSFVANSGDLIWITGTNGSGKTSLLKCLAGLLRPTIGHFEWPETKPSIAYLGHNDGHKSSLTVFENLEFWHSIYQSQFDLENIMKQVRIWELRNLAAKNLSAGQSRRVALVRLILKDAKLWLLDEPSAPMDAIGRDLINTLIDAHLSKNGIALIATHSSPRKIGSNAQILRLGALEDG